MKAISEISAQNVLPKSALFTHLSFNGIENTRDMKFFLAEVRNRGVKCASLSVFGCKNDKDCSIEWLVRNLLGQSMQVFRFLDVRMIKTVQ